MLDDRSPLPLYQQLADEIGARIRAGEFPAGEKIPSENELAARYKLGRPTVRQATEVLVRRRVLERRRGSGTFVTDRAQEVDLLSLGGTLASFERVGVDLSTRLTRKLRLRPVRGEAANPFNEASAFTLERLGSVSRKPVLLERMFFSERAFPGLDEVFLECSSASQAVSEQFGLEPVGGRQTFTVVDAGRYAKALGVDEKHSLLLVRRLLDFPRFPSAVFAELYCLTDEFVFTQQLTNS